MAFSILAEWLARIEHKVDLALTRLQFLDKKPYQQLQFVGISCPVCTLPVDYQVDVQHGVVKRRCGCTTGKLPPLIPLVPVTGDVNGNSGSAESESRSKRAKNTDGGEES